MAETSIAWRNGQPLAASSVAAETSVAWDDGQPFAVTALTEDGAGGLAPPLIASTATLFAPTLTPGGVSIAPPLVAGTAVAHAPTLTTAGTLAPPLIASVAQVFAPTVGAFSPANISGLQFWIKADAGVYADAGVTPATDGGTVQQWSDQSGNGNHVSQATAGSRPTYRAPASGDTGGVVFTNGKALLNAGAAFPNGAAALTTFAVFERNDYGIAYALAGTTSAGMELLNDGGGSGRHYMLFSTGSLSQSGMAPREWLIEHIYDGSQGTDLTKSRTWGSGVAQAGAASVGPLPATLAASNGIQLGKSGFQGTLAELVVYNRVLTTDERDDVRAYLLGRYSQGSRKYAACIGDSDTIGHGGGQAGSWPSQLAVGIGAGWKIANYGMDGSRASEWVSTYWAQLVLPPPAHPRDVVIFHIGRNDIEAGSTDVQVLASVRTLWAAARAAGYTVGACTSFDTKFQGTAPQIAQKEAYLTSLNTLVRADGANYDFLCDLAAPVELSDWTDTTYFNADSHLTAAGYAVAAGVVQDALEALDTLSPPLLASTSALYAPTVSPGAVVVAPPMLESAAQLFGPALTVGGVSLLVPLLASGGAVYAPTLGGAVLPGSVGIGVTLAGDVGVGVSR
jgi:lysophospholipase L1-like esterase